MPSSETESGLWSVEGLPVRIDYSLPVLRDVAAVAVDGLYRFRHGGVEVGGVLFGVSEAGAVSVAASRPLACEHAFGPRFVLSDRDRAAMKQLLDLPHHDPALAGLIPVGWYHSHTRSEIALSPRDMEIYDRFFPHAWQVALVLRPESYGAASAAFFVREHKGAVQSEEFLIRPERTGAAPPTLEPRETAPPPPVPPPARRVRAVTLTPESDLETTPLPSFVEAEPEPRRRWVWLAASIVVALAGGAGVEAYYRYTAPQQSLTLFVADVGGQLLIDWDRTARPIREARSAIIEIQDGADHRNILMTGDRLREGSLSYTRQSEIVDVRLRVEPLGARPAQEFIRFVGQPIHRASTAESAAIQQRDALKAEVEKLRAEIQRRDARARRARTPVPRPTP
jgi:proteasome lid subunit RPN8/RPN11